MTWFTDWLQDEWTTVARAGEWHQDEDGDGDLIGELVSRHTDEVQPTYHGQGLSEGVRLTRADVERLLAGDVLLTYPNGGEYVLAVFVEDVP